MKIALFLFLVFAPLCEAGELPIVYLFGGVASQKKQMDRCTGQQFRNIPISRGSAGVNEVLKEIKSHPDQRYVVAGHSSGAKFSKRLGWKLKGRDNKNVRIISLDGYAPDGLNRFVRTQCWIATNGGRKRSINAKYMSVDRCGEVKRYEAPHCKTGWCLHFSLVNIRAPVYLNGSTFASDGYSKCVANTAWANPWGQEE